MLALVESGVAPDIATLKATVAALPDEYPTLTVTDDGAGATDAGKQLQDSAFEAPAINRQYVTVTYQRMENPIAV